jgi:hypothetical protein
MRADDRQATLTREIKMTKTQAVTEQKLTVGQKYDRSTLEFERFVDAAGAMVDGAGMYVGDWFEDGVYLGPDVDGVEPLFAVSQSYTLVSAKGMAIVKCGSLDEAIAKAVELEARLQPAFGVTVEDADGNTVAEIRDGKSIDADE